MGTTSSTGERPWPTDLKVSADRRQLSIAFESGERFELSAELLRVESPSAEVQGHGGDHKVIVANKRLVTITRIEPVGNYAVRITFDDGHDTGLYSWDVLYSMGREKDRLWGDYEKALADRGLSRG